MLRVVMRLVILGWVGGALCAVAQDLKHLPKDVPLPQTYLLDRQRAEREDVETPKMDSGLVELSVAPNAPELRSKGLSISAGQVYVKIRAIDEQRVAQLRRYVERLGGNVDAVTSDALFGAIPTGAIPQISRSPDVFSVSPQAVLGIHASTVAAPNVSNLAGILKTSKLRVSTARGGMTIGIIDSGFEGIKERVAEGLVAKTLLQSFVSPSGTCQGTDDSRFSKRHGTAVAEVISSIAPNANLVIAEVDGCEGTFVRAVQWLVSSENGKPIPDIINYSGGKHRGPHDGHDTLDELISKEVVSRGIIWLNAAGNEADKHLLIENALPKPGRRFIDVPNSPVDEGIVIRPRVDKLTVLVTWTPWPRPGPFEPQDIDWILYQVKAGDYIRSKGVPQEIMHSNNSQLHNQDPVEQAGPFAVVPGETYVLKLISVRQTKPVRLHVFLPGFEGDLQPYDPAGSIAIPAANRDVIAVGAINTETGLVEPYSSRGPVDGNSTWMKPDLSGYDNITTPENGVFVGTSVASATAAGYASIVLQQCRSTSTHDIAEFHRILLQSVRPLGPRNNDVGLGVIDADYIPKACLHPVSARARQTITISDDRLTQLRDQRSPELSAQIATGRDGMPPVYAIGETMTIAIQVSRDSTYLLLNRDSSGMYQRIAPIDSDPSELRANEITVIPSSREEVLHVTGPPGPAKVILIVTDKSITPNEVLSASDPTRYRGHAKVVDLDYWVNP